MKSNRSTFCYQFDFTKTKSYSFRYSKKINEAFRRSATIDAGKITAEVVGSKVILRGTVRSFAERDDAEIAAWNAPGVYQCREQTEFEMPVYSNMTHMLLMNKNITDIPYESLVSYKIRFWIKDGGCPIALPDVL